MNRILRTSIALIFIALAIFIFPKQVLGQRVTSNLVTLYDFTEGSGASVNDQIGNLDLNISNTSAVAWESGCGLHINAATIIQSPAPATALRTAMQATNEFTLEAWVTPANLTQNGPARIITFSESSSSRNVTLGQGQYTSATGDYIAARRRTTNGGSSNGSPDIATGVGSITTALQHFIYTRNSAGQERIYINGIQQASTTVAGNLGNWGNYYFALANEIGLGRPWLGTYHLVALYNRDLSSAEVQQNYNAGTCIGGNPSVPVPTSFNYDCNDGVIVSVQSSGADIADNPDARTSIPDHNQVTQIVAEVVYKGANPGPTVQVYTNGNVNHTLQKASLAGLSSSVHVYRGLIETGAPWVGHNSATGSAGSVAGLQSLVTYAYKSTASVQRVAGEFTGMSGYCNINNFSIAIPTDSDGERNVTVNVPISELTDDGRYLTIAAEAGGVSNQVTIFGPEDECCIAVPSIFLQDVPGNATSVNITVYSDTANSPNGTCGQSYVIAGLVHADVECASERVSCNLVANAGTNQAVCAGNTANLQATASNGTPPYTYAWSNGASTATNNNVAIGNYTVTITDDNGCTADASVSVQNLNCADISGFTWNDYNADGIKDGSEPVLAGVMVRLLNQSQQELQSTQTLADGNYSFTNLAPANYFIAFDTPTEFTISPQNQGGNDALDSDINTSTGRSASLTLQPNTDINNLAAGFHNSADLSLVCTVDNPNASVGTQTNFRVRLINDGPDNASNVQVKNYIPSGINNVTNIDNGGNLVGNEIEWNNLSVPANNQRELSFRATILPAGNYENSAEITLANQHDLDSTPGNGANNEDDADVALLCPITASIAAADPICAGETATLTATVQGATGTLTYNWSPGALSGASVNVSPNTTTTYNLTVTDDAGCSTTAQTTLTVDPSFTSGINGVTTVCAQEEVTFTAVEVAGASYSWSITGPASVSSASGSSVDVEWASLGVYTLSLTVTRGACEEVYNHDVNITGPVWADAGPDLTICVGGNTQIGLPEGTSAPIAASYVWSPSSSLTEVGAAQPVASPAQTQEYVMVTSLNGCVRRDSMIVTVDRDFNPIADAGPDQLVCQSTALTLQGSPTSAVPPANPSDIIIGQLWFNTNDLSNILSTDPSLSVTPSVNTQYQVVSFTASGCTDTAFVDVNIVNDIDLSASVSNPVACNGENTGAITLNVSGGTGNYTYNWADLAGTNNVANRTNLSAGSYSVTVSDDGGCSATENFTVTEPNSLDIDVAGTVVEPANCNGEANGSISLTVNGGTPAYTFAWSNGASTANLSNLSAGTYTVTVSDANGCTDSESFTVSEPNELSIDVAGTVVEPANCNGEANGSISLTVNGGTPAYSFAWSNGANTANLTNLSAGTYTVTVSDANGCTDSESFTVSEPNELSIDVAGTVVEPANCNGEASGSISLTVNGGTPAYSFAWSNGASTANLTNLSAGTYTVTVSDANGCTDSESFTVSEPNELSIDVAGTVVEPANCNGEANGSISLTVNGGTPAYSFAWSNGANTANLTNLSAGTYTVTVSDANGCTDSESFTVSEPSELNIDVAGTVVEPANCNGEANGSISLTVNGGTPAYTFAWSNGASTANLTNLSAGTYTVTVSDANGCTDSESFTVSEPNELSIDVAGTVVEPANCNGEANGSISLTVNGGTPAYSFAWSNGANTANLTNLSAGTYTVTVSDANGCTDSESFTVSEPNELSIDVAGTVVEPANCNGEASGSISLTVNGGTPAYTFAWSNGANTANLSNLSAGTYSVTVSDANGCTDSESFTVSEPTALAIDLSNTTVVEASCNGDANGSISLVVNGGTPAYTYAWSTGANTANISNLNTGSYSVTVTDANGCTDAESFTVGEPNSLSIDLANTTVSDIACNGDANGSINVAVTGGTPAYTFAWNTGESTASLNNLNAGTYTITVSDANGCTDTENFTINEPTSLAIDAAASTVVDVLCNGDANGSINVVVNGGTPAYSFAWSNGASTANLTNLNAGTYTLTLTDANGCTDTESFTINEPASLAIDAAASTVVDALCNGDANGSISVVVNGGTPAYSFAWSNGASTANLTNLNAGTYTLTLTDANGCTDTESFTINEPASLAIDAAASTVVDALCNGDANGSISVVVNGGTPAYSFAWSNGASTANLNNLNAGTYTLTLTDANGCTDTESFTVNEPNTLAIDLVASTVSNVLCNGDANGSISVVVNGGTPTYSFAWSNGANTANLNNLSVGTYTLTVSDANGCSDIESFTITEPDPLAIDEAATLVTAAACNGDANGTISLVVNGGTLDYSFLWNTGATTANLSGLSAGTYTVTVTDANGCTDTASFDVDEPSTVGVDLAGTVISGALCQGDPSGTIILSLGGGTAPYVFDWADIVGGVEPANRVGLVAGTYSVTVTDANGCSDAASFDVSEPQFLEVDLAGSVVVNAACNGDANGSINLLVNGGIAPFTFDWDDQVGSVNDMNRTGLSAGTYTVTVTDANNCDDTASFEITEPSALAIDVAASTISPAECNGETSGSVNVVVNGGTPAYTFTWSDGGAAIANRTDLIAGTHTVTVTDANACEDTANFTITEPSALAIDIAASTVVAAECNGDASGSINVVVNGGTPAYTFTWSDGGATTANRTGLSAGSYTVTVTDANSCEDVANFDITEPNALNIDLAASTVVAADCSGGASGSINVVVNGGTPTYTFTWSDGGAATANRTGLSAGVYTVTVSDANGCEDTANFDVAEPNALSIDVAASVISHADCNGDANASINVVVNGGTPAYVFTWSDIGVATANRTGLSAGTYTVTVSDANSCEDVASFDITEPNTLVIDLAASVVNNVACNGDANGSINVVVNGGTPAYTFTWADIGVATANRTGLDVGSYTLTVTDINGCEDVANFNITEPNTLAIDIAASTVVAAECNGDANGSINVVVNGGTPAYTFTWSDVGAATANRTGLSAGTYTVTVSDANGCEDVANFNITEPNSLAIDIAATTIVAAECSGDATGSINVVVNGGTPAYTFTWSDGGATTANRTGLSAGTYTVTVTDANDCEDVANFDITEPNALTIDLAASVVTNVDCNGDANGSINVVVNGGTPTYTFTWSDGGATTANRTALSAGTYTVTVSDINGCEDIASFDVTEPDVLEIDLTASTTTAVACNGESNGSINVVVNGGTPTYTFTWSDGGAATANRTGLSAGTYTVTVSDVNGCEDMASFDITEPNTLAIDLAATTVVAAECSGDASGSINVVVNGGTPTYTFTWSDGGAATANRTGLSAGSYTVTVSDANGCEDTANFDIAEPNALTIDLAASSLSHALCNGDANGSINVVVNGGTPTYTFTWSDGGAATANRTGLNAGTYTVTVSDVNACEDVASFEITEPAELSATTTVLPSSCDGTGGSISVVVAGGTPNYTFVWSNGETTANLTALGPDTYTVTITDANNCELIENYTIENSCFDLALTKIAQSTATLIPGSNTAFTITVVNQGNIDATNIEITDYIPTGLILTDANWTQTGNLATRIIPSLLVGQSTTIDINFQVDPSFGGGDIINIAEISDAQNTAGETDTDATYDQIPDNDAGGLAGSPADNALDGDGTAAVNSADAAGDEDDHDPAIITVTALVDLSVSKTVNNATPLVNETVIYTITLNNAGPANATNITLEDQLPSGLTYVSHIGGNYNPLTGLWTVASLNAGQSQVLTVEATVNPTGDYLNCVEVIAQDQGDSDSTPANAATLDEDDNDCALISPLAIVDLSVEKTASTTTATLGDIVEFTIVLENEGPSTATGVTIDEAIASGFSFNTANATQGNYDAVNGIWTVGSLAAGASASLTINVTVLANGDFCNQAFVATVNETDVDSTPGNGVDTDGDGEIEDDADDEDDGDAVCIEVPCEVQITVNSISACNDNGTPSNPDDDFVTVNFVVTGINVSDSWSGQSNRGDVLSGAYGVPSSLEVTIRNEDNEQIFLTFSDDDDPSCTNTIIVDIPSGCSDECILTPSITTLPYCDDGGTPSDPSDDTYFFDVTVVGVNVGDQGWTAEHQINGVLEQISGNYNEPTPIGPLSNFGGPQMNLVFEDNEFPDCSPSLVILESPEPPEETCSSLCQLSAEIDLIQCSDNGTEADPSDDYFYAYITVNGSNGSFQGWDAELSNGTVHEGDYNESSGFGDFLVSEGNATVVIYDHVDTDCEITVNIPNPGTCSTGCEIDVDVFGPECNDNGTPFDPSDDTYTFGLRVIPTGDYGSGWRFSLGNGMFENGGAYGEIIEVTRPIPTILAPQVFNIVDNQFISCDVAIEIVPPAACSDLVCAMDINYQTECNDNNTPFDITDDTYSLNVIVNNGATPPSAGWTLNLPTGTVNGVYGENTLVGNFPIGTDLNLLFEDQAFPADCSTTIDVVSPPACSTASCEIDVTYQTECDNNGTPFDDTDDTYSVSVVVSNGATPPSAGWTLTLPTGTITGNYGENTLVGNFPIGEDQSLLFADQQTPADCATTIDVISPASCSDEACSLTIVELFKICDDNGTPNISTDDTYQVMVNVTASVTGTPGWQAGAFSNPYGVPVLIGPFDVGTDVNLVFTDQMYPDDCAVNFMATSTPACSEANCDMELVLLDTICNNNATPFDPSDDSYSVQLQVNSANLSGTWSATVAGQNFTGAYNTVEELGPLAIGTDVNIEVIANAADCAAAILVPSPQACSTAVCEIDVTYQTECDNNGTPFDDTDDTYSVSVVLTNGATPPSAGWTLTLPTGTITGNYGENTLVGNFPIGEDQSLLFADQQTPADCATTIDVISPASCSDEACSLTIVELFKICDDNGTPNISTDDTYQVMVNVTASVTGTPGWQAGAFSNPYGVPVLIGPFDVGTDVNLVFTDQMYPDDCAVNFMATSTEACSEANCDMELVLLDTICNNNATPFDPSDDSYSVQLQVNSANLSGTWSATVAGQNFTGAYNTVEELGPFAIGTDVNIEVIANAADCAAAILVPSPQACSTAVCEIDVTYQTECDNSGTPFDDTDDTYSVSVVVSNGATPPSAGWTLTLPTGTITGNYGENTLVGNFPIGEDQSLLFADQQTPADCATTIDVISPASCSDEACSLTIVELFKICDDNGTPNISTDDTYQVMVNVTASVTGTPGWQAGAFSNPYGVPVLIGPFDVGTDVNLVFTDQMYPDDCAVNFMATSTEACSEANCDMELVLLDTICNNNATPFDPSDDSYSVQLQVNSANLSGTWSATVAGQNFTGAYNTVEELGPFAIGTDVNIEVTADAADCAAAILVPSPQACSNDTFDCDLTYTVTKIFDDGGTPYNYEDDQYDIVILASNGGYVGTYSLEIFAGETLMGTYDEELIVSDVSANSDYTFTLTDNEHPDCDLVIRITGQLVIGNYTWVDTNANGIQDEDELGLAGVEIILSGFGQAGAVNETQLSSENGQYLFTDIAPGGYSLTFTLPNGYSYTQATQGTNTDVDSNPDPLTGSTPTSFFASTAQYLDYDAGFIAVCNITTTQIDTLCIGNNFFTTSFDVNGDGTGWQALSATGVVLTSGAYGEAFSYDFSSITGQTSIPITIVDASNAACSTELDIPVPTCPVVPPCAMTVTHTVFTCNDQATPQTTDDTFSAIFTVTGNNTGSCFTYTINGGEVQTANYGIPVFLSEVSSLEGDLDIVIEDCDVAACGAMLTIESPCSEGQANDCSLVCPEDVSNYVNEAGELEDFSCEQENEIFNATSSLALTGQPTIAGDGCTLIDMSFEDQWLEGACTDTILRTFTAYVDNGAGIDTLMCIQHIFFQDTEAPLLSCAEGNYYDETLAQWMHLFPVDTLNCTADVMVPMPAIVDACGADWTLAVELLNTNNEVVYTIAAGEAMLIPSLAIGDYTLAYTATDACGNVSSTLYCPIRIADQSAPTANCVSGLQLSLGAFGMARVYSNAIDDGSYDDCGLESIQIRRLFNSDPITCDSLLTPVYGEWSDFVDFSCCDAGQYVDVELLVTDVHGHTDTCSTAVLVRDNSLPYCTGLFDQLVSCDDLPADFDPYNTTQLATLYGLPEVSDNCSAEVIELTPEVNMNSCGAGTILRRFRAVDRAGNESISVYEQLITIDYVLSYNIMLPADISTNCTADIPSVQIQQEACDNIEITYEDVYLNQTGAECYFIERTYTITNTCEWNGTDAAVHISRDENCNGQEGEQNVWILARQDHAYIDKDAYWQNANPTIGEMGFSCTGSINPLGYWRTVNSTGRWVYTQRIKIHDDTAPVLSTTATQAFCTDSVACEALIELPIVVQEYCLSEQITFNLSVDVNADGSIDQVLEAHEWIQGDFPDLHIRGSFMMGTHIMHLEATDACGNTANIEIPFEVVDCYIPDIVCYSGLNAILQELPAETDADGDGENDAAAVVIYANQLASCNVSECSLPMRYSLNLPGQTPDITRDSIVLTCKDKGSLELEVYVWDGANNPYAIQPDGSIGGPNYTSCTVAVEVIDPDAYCEECPEDNMILAGDIYTWQEESLKDVEVFLEAVVNESMMTELDGKYRFEDLEATQSYVVRPHKNDDTPNGVTTLDLIRIQRHLLDYEPITNPYQLIAADVNNSGTITTIDLIKIRRVILGDLLEFENNTSWRFVRADYVFPDPLNPWAFPETIEIDELTSCFFNGDFIAIKIGDVNGSASTTGLLENPIEQMTTSWSVYMQDMALEAGQKYELLLQAPDIKRVQGFQFTLDYDPADIQLMGLEEALLTKENTGQRLRKQGMLTISWNADEQTKAQAQLMKLSIKALKTARLSELLSLNSAYTQAEAYLYENANERMMVNLIYTTSALADLELYQNWPNPVTTQTTIPFNLPKAGWASLEVYNMNGQKVLSTQNEYLAGHNEYVLKTDQLTAGVYLYTLRYEGQALSRKMVISR